MAEPSDPDLPTKAYEPTEAEASAVEVVRARKYGRTRGSSIKMDFDPETRTNEVSFDHPDQQTAAALAMFDMGTGDPEFFCGLMKQITSLGEPGKPVSEDATNFALGVIRSIDPQDEIEAMLGAQMAATHQATMMMARRLNHVETLAQQDAAERAYNKLARTFTAQVEALKRHRAKASQTVRVERVTVEDGGQAIVGTVQHGGRGKDET